MKEKSPRIAAVKASPCHMHIILPIEGWKTRGNERKVKLRAGTANPLKERLETTAVLVSLYTFSSSKLGKAELHASIPPNQPFILHHPLIRRLTSVAPAGSVDDDASEAPGHDARDGEGHDPAHVDPGNHAPVDGAPGAGAETDTDGGAGDTLSGGDGEGWK